MNYLTVLGQTVVREIGKHLIEIKKDIEQVKNTEIEAKDIKTDETHQFVTSQQLDKLDKGINLNDPVTNNTVTFTQAESRTNIASGEKLSAIFGKVMKYFADLKAVAFSGSYTDLANRPTLGSAASQAVANNCTTATAGSVLDARQGQVLQTNINQVNSNLTTNVNAITGTWLGNNKLSFDGTNFYATASNGVKKKLGDPIFVTVHLSRSDTSNLGNNIYRSTFLTGITGKLLWQTILVSTQNGVSFGGGTVEPIREVSYNAANGIITIDSWYWRNDGIYVHYTQ